MTSPISPQRMHDNNKEKEYEESHDLLYPEGTWHLKINKSMVLFTKKLIVCFL